MVARSPNGTSQGCGGGCGGSELRGYKDVTRSRCEEGPQLWAAGKMPHGGGKEVAGAASWLLSVK